MQYRGRAANHLDAFDHPRVDREGLGAGTGVQARAVEQGHHRAVAGKSAGRQACTAVPRGADEGDARRAGHSILHRDVVALLNLPFADAAGAGRCFQGAEAKARAGLGRRGQVDGAAVLGVGDGRGRQGQRLRGAVISQRRQGNGQAGRQGVKLEHTGHVVPLLQE
ncbi:hypothetical protein D3C79_763370 [compost metagenome]